MDEEVTTAGTPHTVEVLSSALILFAGVCVFLAAVFTQPRGNWDGLFPAAWPSVTEVAALYEQAWSPRSRLFPSADARPEDDPRGRSPVYWIATSVVVAWTLATAVWYFVLGVDTVLLVYRSDRFVHASFYIAGAFALCGLWFVPFRQGRPCYMWLAFLLLAVAHVLCLAAEVTFQPWTYPGTGLWLFSGLGYSLTSGWILYGASLTYGMAIASDSAPDGTQRLFGPGHSYSFVAVFVCLYAMIASIALPSPALPFWFVVVLLLYVPREPFLMVAVVISLIGIVASVFRVLALRGII
tara:strand:+ start:1683 stop:2573 length:891 start_codon:yes stop_codon:yes gene_type:complete